MNSPTTSVGRFKFVLTGSYYIRYDVQQPDGTFAGFISNAFQAPATGITPRWKSYQALTWDYGRWSATLGNSYQSSYIDVSPDPNGDLRRVGTLSLWDLQGSYTGFKNFTLTLGVKTSWIRILHLPIPISRSRAATILPTMIRGRVSSTAQFATRSSNARS